MKKSWSVFNTGKIQFVLIYVGLFTLLLIAITLRYNHREVNELGAAIAIRNTFIYNIIFTIPTLVIPIYWILRKQVPKKISLDSHKIDFVFSKRKTITVQADILYYSIEDSENFYTMSFYQYQRIDQNGGFVDVVTRINAPYISMGWRKSQLEDVVNSFKELGIKEYQLERKTNFFDRLI